MLPAVSQVLKTLFGLEDITAFFIWLLFLGNSTNQPSLRCVFLHTYIFNSCFFCFPNFPGNLRFAKKKRGNNEMMSYWDNFLIYIILYLNTFNHQWGAAERSDCVTGWRDACFLLNSWYHGVSIYKIHVHWQRCFFDTYLPCLRYISLAEWVRRHLKTKQTFCVHMADLLNGHTF